MRIHSLYSYRTKFLRQEKHAQTKKSRSDYLFVYYRKLFSEGYKLKMKKVNKQCLLDTPRTVRVSEKTWQEDLSFDKKISVVSVQTKIINSFMHMFNVSTLYRQSIKLLHQKL